MLAATITTDWEGRPLHTLSNLIEKRSEQLGESAHDALYATAQTFIRSLGPQVKVAKPSKASRAYDIEDTGLEMGKYKGRFVPHHRFQGDYRTDLHPICLWGGGVPQHRVRVYKITPRHGKRMQWRQNRHQGCWYVAAYNKSVARDAAKRLMKTAIEKNRGLARTAINAMRVAIARLENEGGGEEGLMDAVYGAAQNTLLAGRQLYRLVQRFGGLNRIGDAQYTMTHAGDRSNFGLILKDNLDYATQSLKSGESSISLALMKASNSIVGYMRRRAKDIFDPTLKTPFPEIARHR